MLAYHNSSVRKAFFVNRYESHRKLDEVVQGTGFFEGKGCFVGCCLDDYKHKDFEIEMGWPEWLASLADDIFEHLPTLDAPQFGSDLLEAVQPGVDLEQIRVPFILSLLKHELKKVRSRVNSPLVLVVQGFLEGVTAWLESGGEDENQRVFLLKQYHEIHSEWEFHLVADPHLLGVMRSGREAIHLSVDFAVYELIYRGRDAAEIFHLRDDLLTMIRALKPVQDGIGASVEVKQYDQDRQRSIF